MLVVTGGLNEQGRLQRRDVGHRPIGKAQRNRRRFETNKHTLVLQLMTNNSIICELTLFIFFPPSERRFSHIDLIAFSERIVVSATSHNYLETWRWQPLRKVHKPVFTHQATICPYLSTSDFLPQTNSAGGVACVDVMTKTYAIAAVAGLRIVIFVTDGGEFTASRQRTLGRLLVLAGLAQRPNGSWGA